MKDNNLAKAAFLSIPLLFFSYILSSFVLLMLNKVPMAKAIKMYHLNLIYEAIEKGYPNAWLSLLIAIILSALLLAAAFVFMQKMKVCMVKLDLQI